MKILILRNIPKNLNNSSTYKLEKYFIEKLSCKNKIKFHDLYRDNRVPRVDIFTLNKVILKSDKFSLKGKAKNIWKQKIAIAKEFTWADKIVIFSPFWTGFFPSLLKDYIDLLPVKNITYTISQDKQSIKGNHGGEFIMIQSMGSNSENNSENYGYKLISRNFSFYGIKKCSNIIWEETSIDKSKKLKEVKKKIKAKVKEWNSE